MMTPQELLAMSGPQLARGRAISHGKLKAMNCNVVLPQEPTPIFFPSTDVIAVFADGSNPTTIMHTFYAN